MSSSKDQLTGYLTVVAVPDLGHCGGLLIVNRLGRPIEFHCTSPVAENKTQKVLYGNTYHAFLYADQIGRALLKKVKRQPDLLVVRQQELVGLQDLMDIPVARLAVGDCNDFDDCSEMNESDQARGNSIESRVRKEEIGGETFFFSSGKSNTEWVGILEALSTSIPIGEPFERVEQAITEAVAVAKPVGHSQQAA